MVGIALAAVKVVEVDSAVVAKFTRAAVGISHGRFFLAMGRTGSRACRVGRAGVLAGRIASAIDEAVLPPYQSALGRARLLAGRITSEGINAS